MRSNAGLIRAVVWIVIIVGTVSLLQYNGVNVWSYVLTMLQGCLYFLVIITAIVVVNILLSFFIGKKHFIPDSGVRRKRKKFSFLDERIQQLFDQPLADDEMRPKLNDLAQNHPAFAPLRSRRSKGVRSVTLQRAARRHRSVYRFLEAHIWSPSYRAEVARIVFQKDMSSEAVLDRLLLLANILSDKTATELYEQYPDLLRRTFRFHLSVRWGGSGYPQLLDKLLANNDSILLDHLATECVVLDFSADPRLKSLTQMTRRLTFYYRELREDTEAFPARAANVLSGIAAGGIEDLERLTETNSLANLFFRCPQEMWLSASAAGQLLRAADSHVQTLGLQAVALEEERARAVAAEHLELLEKFLFRNVKREMRGLALQALSNAANNAENAKTICRIARLTLERDRGGHPQEKLIGLIARTLHRWPEARSPEEQPVIYQTVDSSGVER